MDPPSDKPTRVLEDKGRKSRDMKVGIVAAIRRKNEVNTNVLAERNSLNYCMMMS
jgi:hypothetical protein